MLYREQASKHSISYTKEDQPSLSIIIPTYNEAENIPELFKRISRSLNNMSFEIIIVDDESPDGTADVAETLRNKYINIKVIRRHCKLGLGSAIKDGIRLTEAELLVVMDADLQHPPELLPIMYEKVSKGCDLVIASRYIDGDSVEEWTLLRKLMSKVAILLAHLLLPNTRKIRDILSGYFMFKRHIINGIKLETDSFKILLEILVKKNCSQVIEVPYVFRRRKKGASKMNFKEIINYVALLLKLLMFNINKSL